jgi:hypothetical protein
LGPLEFRCVPKFAGTTAGSNGGGRSHFDGTWAYAGFTNNWGGRGSGFWIVSGGLIIGRRGLRYRSRQSGWGL